MSRFWPQSLSSRLALVLIGGMLAAQALTGTIWYDTRYGNAMEVPARLTAIKIADDLAVLEAVTVAQRPALEQALNNSHFQIGRIAAPLVQNGVAVADTPRFDTNDQAVAGMLKDIVERRLGYDPHLQVQDISLDRSDGSDKLWTLLTERNPMVHFTLQAELRDGSHYRIRSSVDQAGMDMEPVTASLDYLLRIYVLRFAIIVLLAWFAVRLVLKPLSRLAAAAEQLGRNIHSKPLVTDGPVEVSKAAHAFNAMQRRLIDNLAERTRFLAAVSHDLRSPITRMKLRTELLDADTVKEKFRQDLEEMDALISATLNVIRDADPGEKRQLIDIDSLLLSLQSDLAETGASVTIHGHARALYGYPRSLRRCLQNLVENAVRYGDRADIKVHDAAQQLEILIADEGPGIPDDMLVRVLEPYYRVEPSRNSQTGGFGLGLSIAHTVVQAHQGTLVLRNGKVRGLLVSLTLPRAVA